jgi:hypothetical protein
MTDSSDTARTHVLSLCDRTGNMVRPWAEAGYECIVIDVQHDGERVEDLGDGRIRFIESDVRDYDSPDSEYAAAFAFPPCTHLAGSGARWWKEKGLESLAESIELVAACHETLVSLDCPWMLENPVGALSTHWREPDYTFDPCEFDGYTDGDDAYTKKTCLWTGSGFRMPRSDGMPRGDADDRIHKMGPSEDRSDKRAATPMGFARAVFLAQTDERYARPDTLTQQATLTNGGVVN